MHFTREGRQEDVLEVRQLKEPTYDMAAGRAMQVHAVPFEERAIDSKGNRLPWALEWPE